MSRRSSSSWAQEVWDEPATVTFAGRVRHKTDGRAVPVNRRDSRSRSPVARRTQATRKISGAVAALARYPSTRQKLAPRLTVVDDNDWIRLSIEDLWWSWGYDRNYSQNDLHTALQLHARDDQGGLRYDIRGDVVNIRCKKEGVQGIGSLASETARDEPAKDRVSKLDHVKLFAASDEKLLLAYRVFQQDQQAFAKVWPRSKDQFDKDQQALAKERPESKVLSETELARQQVVKNMHVARALRCAARSQYWLRPCGSTS